VDFKKEFDFIHIRCSYGSVIDRTKFYVGCFGTSQQGGYIEQVEYSPHIITTDDSILADTPIAQWNEAFAGAFPQNELFVHARMKNYIRQAGFENVYEKQ
jgi:hypothetical protein